MIGFFVVVVFAFVAGFAALAVALFWLAAAFLAIVAVGVSALFALIVGVVGALFGAHRPAESYAPDYHSRSH
jgi:hypothetical protein